MYKCGIMIMIKYCELVSDNETNAWKKIAREKILTNQPF